jgi:dTDP-4-amino-4,6-dideoxygalactose transaminase
MVEALQADSRERDEAGVFANRFESSRIWPPKSRAVVPFNRLETRLTDLIAAWAWIYHSDPLAKLCEAFRHLTGQQHILFAPSGQCAIAQILASLPQREVVMPAYMCYQVKKAAEVAGKHIIYVDLAKNSVNATSAEYSEAAKPGRILLAAHLYGVPTDIEAICELARNRDCVTIEDAVPAFGGRRNGRLLGTFADFGVFSFQQSKRLSAFHGAVIVVNNDRVLNPMKLGATRLAKTRRALPVGELAQALVHLFVTTPWVYRRLTLPLLPFREVVPRFSRRFRYRSATVQTNKQSIVPAVRGNPYYTREIHPYQAELVLRMLKRLEEIRQRIGHLAAIYLKAFHNRPIATFLPPGCDNAGLMRFPIAFPRKDREEILRLARSRGVQLKVLWDRLLPEESEHARFPNALWAARNIALLPLYTALAPTCAELLAQNVVDIERNVPAM